ncbi:hypothetical protein IW147_001716 [Coemansia sp. RSA 720]|nr:hypothetical protein IW147_001716 [Coemansia sp. RSA 720]
MKRGLPWGNVLGRVLNTAVSVLFSQALESFLVSTDYPAVPGVLQHVVYKQGIAVFLSSPAALARLEKAIEFYSQATSIVIRIKHCKVVQVGTEPDQAIPDNWTKIPRGQKVKYFNSEFSMQA